MGRYKLLDRNVDSHALVLRDGNKALCSREVYVLGSQPIPPENKRRRFVQVRGLDDAVVAGKVHGLELLEGQWFSDVGVQAVLEE